MFLIFKQLNIVKYKYCLQRAHITSPSLFANANQNTTTTTKTKQNKTKQNKTKPNESITKTKLGTETATEKSGQQCHENLFS